MSINISAEIIFQTARSGGKGGQNVNKVETMVEGRWNIDASAIVTDEQKIVLKEKLASRITTDGLLLVKSQAERTQLGNKELVVKKMNALVNKALEKKRTRIATKVPKAVQQKRIENKKQKGTIKDSRKKLKPGDY